MEFVKKTATYRKLRHLLHRQRANKRDQDEFRINGKSMDSMYPPAAIGDSSSDGIENYRKEHSMLSARDLYDLNAVDVITKSFRSIDSAHRPE